MFYLNNKKNQKRFLQTTIFSYYVFYKQHFYKYNSAFFNIFYIHLK